MVKEQLQSRWVGCDWPTKFGAVGLNLCGVTAHQAALLARATSGEEATAWQEAAEWLTKVEADAEAARQSAWLAQQAAAAGRLQDALEFAQHACDLERSYHASAVWDSLHNEIQSRMSDGD